MSSTHTYSLTDCLDAIRTVSDSLDAQYMSKKTYDDNRAPQHPCSSTIDRYTDGWIDAQERAGLDPTGYTGRGPSATVSEDDCLDAIRAVADELDVDHVTTSQYNESKDDDHPCNDTIIRLFGSWSTAHDRAGLETWKNPNSRNRYDVADCLDALRAVADELGDSYVSKQTYDAERSEAHPSSETIKERCSLSWSGVHDEAGLCPSQKESRQYIWDHGPVVIGEDTPVPCNSSSWRTTNPKFRVEKLSFTSSSSAKATNLDTTVYYVPTRQPLKRAIIVYLEHTPGLWRCGRAYTLRFLKQQFSGIQKQVAENAIEEFFDDLSDEQRAKIE